MTAPPLMVTACMGACGNTKRTASESGRSSSGTIGSKSWPSAPRPCSQITDAVGRRPVSSSRLSSATRIGLALDGVEQVLEEALDVGLVDPAHDGDEVVIGVDPDEAVARAARGERPGAADVEPPEQAVLRIDPAWPAALRDPRRRQELRVAPAAAAQMQQPVTRVILRRPPEAAAPVRDALHRLHA